MNKYFLQGLFLFVFNLNAVSQYVPKQKIDSLRRILPLLKDTARIDCLNELSYQYTVSDKKDSAEDYVTIAYQEAKKLNYVHGIAVYFFCKSQMARHFYDDFIESEALGKESLRWYERTGNKEGMANTYYLLCAAAFAQSKFEEAIGYSEKRFLNAKQNGNQSEMVSALGYIGGIYGQTGDYEKAFLYKQQGYDFFLKANNKIEISSSLYGIAQLYELTGDYPNALIYFRRVLQMDDEETRKQRIAGDNDIWFKMELAEVFSHLHQFDSAWHYYQSFKPSKDKAIYLRVYWVSTGECYLLQKDYQHALQNFQLGLAEHKKLNDRNEIMRTLLDMGKTYLALNNNSEARQYGREGLTLALETKAKQFIRDGYQIISTVYDRSNQTDSANFYFRQYITMKDLVLNDQLKGRFAAYAYEQKIASLNKEKLIEQQQLQIQQQQLKQKSIITKMLIIGIAVIFLLAVIILRNIMLKRKNEAHLLEIAENQLQIEKLENEKKQEELQHKATELEMQALRAQMNPHFVFNCLSSINRFILKNESEAASDYLTKFSRLIRMVLNNSKKESITLDDELEMLRLYLDMERMRFKYSFDYNIIFKNEIDPENIFIPPLLLQPFAENAIWHGLMNKEGPGYLTVSLSKENNILNCIIEDNGVGRIKAAELKSKSAENKKSLGLQITKERLALLNKDSNETAFFEMEDLYDSRGNANGTRVILKIRLLERFEEHSNIFKT